MFLEFDPDFPNSLKCILHFHTRPFTFLYINLNILVSRTLGLRPIITLVITLSTTVCKCKYKYNNGGLTLNP